MKKKLLLSVATILFATLFYSCHNDDVDAKLLKDTLWQHEKSELVFYFDTDGETIYVKNVPTSEPITESGWEYKYTIQDGKITMGYSGILNIYVKPSTHSIKLKGRELTIDFTNGCYILEKEVYVFKKISKKK